MPLPKRGVGISIQWRHGHDNASSDDDRPPVDQGLPPDGGVCSPDQIRTGVSGLKGRRPRPLDDGTWWVRFRLRRERSQPKAIPDVIGLETRRMRRVSNPITREETWLGRFAPAIPHVPALRETRTVAGSPMSR